MEEFDLTKLTPDIRKLNEMKSVAFDKEWINNADNSDMYYMYRGVQENDGLRYDITTIPAIMLGQEFNKTKGHIHVGRWQETYTVLEGQAIYLMQKFDDMGNVADVYAVETKKGQSIVIPSFYGHTTINPSSTEELKMANWSSPDCKSDYSLYEKFGGACYFYTRQGWIKNGNYKSVPELRFENPLETLPSNLDFLKIG
ncbi:MAG TPA: glucose-6-phosphate isomerase family protein [Candidatus Staskawiczbacteria bacterium]|nr:glucose-6-phosphate isomerase family protein [Candidatus Staskawiczbacteria bacterium]